jgi:hypothetical protein
MATCVRTEAVTRIARSDGIMQGELPLAGSIQADFELFHRTNPQIYRALVRLARYHVGGGVSRVSIDYLYHILRWRMFLKTRGKEWHKLNDHFTSRYARLMEQQERDLRGRITMRKLRTY